MPGAKGRRPKSARLFLNKKGKWATWVIRDGTHRIGTGCGIADRSGAERALEAYLAEKHRPDGGDGDPNKTLIADILTMYGRERAPQTARPDVVAGAIRPLIDFWGDKYVGDVTPGRCRDYWAWRNTQPQRRFKDLDAARRVSISTARRELEVLSASINHAHKERRLTYSVPVTLPTKAPARDRWLTRDEAARLLLKAWRGEGKHLARFILVALYTGTRKEAILGLRYMPSTTSGWVDLDAGLIYRRGIGEAESSKRRTPVPISKRLAAHLRRWKKEGGSYVVTWDGTKTGNIRKSWETARKAAGLGPDVTPHMLRHTFATWAVQRGLPLNLIAGALGTTEAIVQRVYGHHSPEYLRAVFESVSADNRPIIGRKG
jgi:integrase